MMTDEAAELFLAEELCRSARRMLWAVVAEAGGEIRVDLRTFERSRRGARLAVDMAPDGLAMVLRAVEP